MWYKNKKADLIAFADTHISDKEPKCRTDSYETAFWKKMDFVDKLQAEHECPIVIAGDVFDNATGNSEYLLAKTINRLKKFSFPIFAIPGQHDLPNHNYNNYYQSALCVIANGLPNLQVMHRPYISKQSLDGINIYGLPWHRDISMVVVTKESISAEPTKVRKVLLMHQLVNAPTSKTSFGLDVKNIFKLFQGYDLIVCGDNHIPFAIRNKKTNTLFLSPGSFMRMDADQIEHRPRVYLWYAKSNRVEKVYLPINKDVIDRNYIDDKKERDSRIDTYRDSLKKGTKLGISFQKNMDRYLKTNMVSNTVETTIHEAMKGNKKT